MTMDNTFANWQIDPVRDNTVVSGEGLTLAVTDDPAIAAWIVERLNFAARAEIKLAQLSAAYGV